MSGSVVRPATRLALAVVLAAALGSACDASLPSPPATRSPSPLPAVTSSVPSPSAVATDHIVLDPGLLNHLPASVDGIALHPSPQTDAIALADPNVARNGLAVATGLAITPAGDQFAYATVLELRPGVFGESFYRGWRDSFDRGACSQAGGVQRHAEATISGRHTFIGSCQGGVRTYHVWLARSGVLVSISSVGDRRLGEKLVAGLRD